MIVSLKIEILRILDQMHSFILHSSENILTFVQYFLKNSSMKKIFLTLTLIGVYTYTIAQKIDKIINPSEVERIEKILSADDMMGREPFTPGIDKAATFIASEFKKSKLDFLGDNKSYFQEFSMIKVEVLEITGMLDKESLNTAKVTANTTSTEIRIDSFDAYDVLEIKKEDNFSQTFSQIFDAEKNQIVLIDTVHAESFKRIQRFTNRAKFSASASQIFVLTSNFNPSTIRLQVKNTLTEVDLKNIVGVIPGKSKKNEFVIFGAHYDHLGVGEPNEELDSIYNGANDDAAGTTAVLMLAKYFSKIKKNQRTLIFVAFTAEEIGGFGSTYFSEQLNPDQVIAMFNIEMIGTESKWGTNSAYITGFEKSNMGKILQENLRKSKFHFEPDPYPKQNLFYRSDNRTFALLGVPAHTISTSKMEEPPNNEPNYHTVNDEIGTPDMKNMAEIIKAIALSSQTILSGKDTPTRVKVMEKQ